MTTIDDLRTMAAASINAHPAIASLLYDIDLLPEQIKVGDTRRENYMVNVIDAMLRLVAQRLETPARDAVLEEAARVADKAARIYRAMKTDEDGNAQPDAEQAEEHAYCCDLNARAIRTLKNAAELPQGGLTDQSVLDAMKGDDTSIRGVAPAAAAPEAREDARDVVYVSLHSVREKWSAMRTRYGRIESDWHLKMPADWPVNVVMTMGELRQLAAIKHAALSRAVDAELIVAERDSLRDANIKIVHALRRCVSALAANGAPNCEAVKEAKEAIDFAIGNRS